MQFVRGMRDKVEKYLDITEPFSVEMNILGNAIYDCCCFGVDETGKLSNDAYMIFYNQEKSPKNEIVLRQNGNNSYFDVNLNDVPAEIAKLVFTVSIDGSGTIAEIKDFLLCIKQNGKECITVEHTKTDFSKETAMVCIEIYRKNGWRMAAVSNGFNGGLSALLSYFGGVEETGSANTNENTAINTNTKTTVSADINTDTKTTGNTDINTDTKINENIDINTDTKINENTDINTDMKTNINTDINTDTEPSVSSVVSEMQTTEPKEAFRVRDRSNMFTNVKNTFEYARV